MIKVGLDTSGIDPGFKSHAQRGIGRYVFELIRALQRTSDPDIKVDFFDHNAIVENGIGSKAIDLCPYGRTTLKQQLLYPLKLSTGPTRDFSFLHFPAHMDAPAWSYKPFVLTVLDLIPLVLSDLYRANKPGWRFRFARWLEIKSIQQAVVLLAISETTANDVVRLLGVSRDRIVVTPLGVDPSFFQVADLRREVAAGRETGVRGRCGIPAGRPIILYVGGHDERKNIRKLVEVAARARAELLAESSIAPALVLAGRITSDRERTVLDGALRDFDMERDTFELGYVPDSELQNLYAESALFLFPSLYEGFGLPVLEAMACGLPVVSSSSSSLPEVVGEAGLLFAPESSEAGCAAVLKILKDTSTARALSELGTDRAKQFSWADTGRKTLEAYKLAGDRLKLGTGTTAIVPTATRARVNVPNGTQRSTRRSDSERTNSAPLEHDSALGESIRHL